MASATLTAHCAAFSGMCPIPQSFDAMMPCKAIPANHSRRDNFRAIFLPLGASTVMICVAWFYTVFGIQFPQYSEQ